VEVRCEPAWQCSWGWWYCWCWSDCAVYSAPSTPTSISRASTRRARASSHMPVPTVRRIPRTTRRPPRRISSCSASPPTRPLETVRRWRHRPGVACFRHVLKNVPAVNDAWQKREITDEILLQIMSRPMCG